MTSVRGPTGSGVGVKTWTTSTGSPATISVTITVSTIVSGGGAVAAGAQAARTMLAPMRTLKVIMNCFQLNISSSMDEKILIFGEISKDWCAWTIWFQNVPQSGLCFAPFGNSLQCAHEHFQSYDKNSLGYADNG
jgi:hypothetical protein